jgi:hypothetical protein
MEWLGKINGDVTMDAKEKERIEYKNKYCIGCLHYHPNKYSGNCNKCAEGSHRQQA